MPVREAIARLDWTGRRPARAASRPLPRAVRAHARTTAHKP